MPGQTRSEILLMTKLEEIRLLLVTLVERSAPVYIYNNIPYTTNKVNVDPTANCGCRPENGGSGVCNCVLGGPQVTC